MGWAKYTRGKLSLPVITGIFCTLAFIGLLYTERISTFSSGSFFRIKSCPRRNASTFKKQHTGDRELKSSPLDNPTDDRFVFEPQECSLNNGKWVFNTSIKPLYTDKTCPYVDRQYSCTKNGRNDSDYLHWEWQPDDCILPRFDPKIALRKLRGKKIMFVGDSIQRNMWESFVCLVQTVIPEDQKSMKMGRVHSVFTAKCLLFTFIGFWWTSGGNHIHNFQCCKKKVHLLLPTTKINSTKFFKFGKVSCEIFHGRHGDNSL